MKLRLIVQIIVCNILFYLSSKFQIPLCLVSYRLQLNFISRPGMCTTEFCYPTFRIILRPAITPHFYGVLQDLNIINN